MEIIGLEVKAAVVQLYQICFMKMGLKVGKRHQSTDK